MKKIIAKFLAKWPLTSKSKSAEERAALAAHYEGLRSEVEQLRKNQRQLLDEESFNKKVISNLRKYQRGDQVWYDNPDTSKRENIVLTAVDPDRGVAIATKHQVFFEVPLDRISGNVGAPPLWN